MVSKEVGVKFAGTRLARLVLFYRSSWVWKHARTLAFLGDFGFCEELVFSHQDRALSFGLSHNGGLMCSMPKLIFQSNWYVLSQTTSTLSRSASNVMQYMYHSYFSKIERCSCHILSAPKLAAAGYFSRNLDGFVFVVLYRMRSSEKDGWILSYNSHHIWKLFASSICRMGGSRASRRLWFSTEPQGRKARTWRPTGLCISTTWEIMKRRGMERLLFAKFSNKNNHEQHRVIGKCSFCQLMKMVKIQRVTVSFRNSLHQGWVLAPPQSLEWQERCHLPHLNCMLDLGCKESYHIQRQLNPFLRYLWHNLWIHPLGLQFKSKLIQLW